MVSTAGVCVGGVCMGMGVDYIHGRTNRGLDRGGSLVQNSTTGDNGTAGGTLSQPVLGIVEG